MGFLEKDFQALQKAHKEAKASEDTYTIEALISESVATIPVALLSALCREFELNLENELAEDNPEELKSARQRLEALVKRDPKKLESTRKKLFANAARAAQGGEQVAFHSSDVKAHLDPLIRLLDGSVAADREKAQRQRLAEEKQHPHVTLRRQPFHYGVLENLTKCQLLPAFNQRRRDTSPESATREDSDYAREFRQTLTGWADRLSELTPRQLLSDDLTELGISPDNCPILFFVRDIYRERLTGESELSEQELQEIGNYFDPASMASLLLQELTSEQIQLLKRDGVLPFLLKEAQDDGEAEDDGTLYLPVLEGVLKLYEFDPNAQFWRKEDLLAELKEGAWSSWCHLRLAKIRKMFAENRSYDDIFPADVKTLIFNSPFALSRLYAMWKKEETGEGDSFSRVRELHENHPDVMPLFYQAIGFVPSSRDTVTLVERLESYATSRQQHPMTHAKATQTLQEKGFANPLYSDFYLWNLFMDTGANIADYGLMILSRTDEQWQQLSEHINREWQRAEYAVSPNTLFHRFILDYPLRRFVKVRGDDMLNENWVNNKYDFAKKQKHKPQVLDDAFTPLKRLRKSLRDAPEERTLAQYQFTLEADFVRPCSIKLAALLAEKEALEQKSKPVPVDLREKIEQLELALKELNAAIAGNTQEQDATRADNITINVRQVLHKFAKNEKIGKSRNRVKQFFKGLLGAFISLLTAGAANLFASYRRQFYQTDTEATLGKLAGEADKTQVRVVAPVRG